MAKSTKAENLFKRLGELDKERRNILKELHSSPEYATQYLKQALDVLLVENKDKWYSRQNDKNQTAYFKLVSLEQLPLGKNVSIPRGSEDKLGTNLTVSKYKSVLAKIKVQWAVLGYNAIDIRTDSEEIQISVFKDIVPQVLNGRTIAKNFDEKAIVRATLNAKKKELEEQLKNLSTQITALK